MSESLFPEHPEFYSRFQMLNQKYLNAMASIESELSDTRSELEKLRQLCLATGIDPNVM